MQVIRRRYEVSKSHPYQVLTHEWKECGEDIVKRWANPGRTLKEDECLRNYRIELSWAVVSYADLLRLNIELSKTVDHLLEWANPAKLPQVLRALLGNMESLQVFLGELETSLQDQPDILGELEQDITTINKKLEAVIQKAADHSQEPQISFDSATIQGQLIASPYSVQKADASHSCVSSAGSFSSGIVSWKVKVGKRVASYLPNFWLGIGVHAAPAQASATSYADNKFYGISVSHTTIHSWNYGSSTALGNVPIAPVEGSIFTATADLTACTFTLSSEGWPRPYSIPLPAGTWHANFNVHCCDISLV